MNGVRLHRMSKGPGSGKRPTPKPAPQDERVRIDMDPDEALRLLLRSTKPKKPAEPK